jgi:hypothetical protein
MFTRASSRIALGATLVIVAGCAQDRRASLTEVIRVPVFEEVSGQAEMGPGSGDDDRVHELHVKLFGRNENPPNASMAKGEATFVVSHDGNSVEYEISVSNIENPFMAHIHMAPAGVNGPIVQWLFPNATTTTPGPVGIGPFSGRLAKGSFTAATFVGTLKGHPMSDLLAAIRSGNAYVNVHTNAGGGPAGPGNLPGGEIRAQLQPKDHNNDNDDR